MKKVPFYFYIDSNDVVVNDTKQSIKEQKLLTEYRLWMGQVTRNNREASTNTEKYDRDIRFLGFVDIKEANHSWFGADQNSDEIHFTHGGSKKITLEFWAKNIKNKKYTVIDEKPDDWGDFDEYSAFGHDGNNIRLVKLPRYDVYKMPTRSSEITKALKDARLDAKQKTGGYMINKRHTHRRNGYGFSLFNSKMTLFDHSSCLTFNNRAKVKADKANGTIWVKCNQTGNYVQDCNVERLSVITDDGKKVRAIKYYLNLRYSSKYNLFFTSNGAALNYGFVRCEATSDWVKPEDVKEIPNAGYHHLSRAMMYKAETAKFTIGLEIEKEDKDARDNIGFQKLFDRTKWCKERDGSLDASTGYELVSPVYDLMSNDMDNDVKGDKDLQTLNDAKYSKNCGGHINLGSNIYSPVQLLWGIKGFLPLLYSIWSVRLDNQYSRVHKCQDYSNSKTAIRVKRNVIEIRIATAVKSTKNMFWRRDLCRIMMNNINKSEAEVLRMMLNPRSILHRHLRKVYNSDRFMEKCNDFVKYSESYNDIKLDNPDWDALDAAKAESVLTTQED